MYLVINKWVIAVKVSDFCGQYLRNHWTLDIGVLGYIGIVWPKEHSPEVRSFSPGTPCIYCIFLMLRIRRGLFRMKLNITARFTYVLVIEISASSAAIILNFNLENQSSLRRLLIFCLWNKFLTPEMFLYQFRLNLKKKIVMHMYCFLKSAIFWISGNRRGRNIRSHIRTTNIINLKSTTSHSKDYT